MSFLTYQFKFGHESILLLEIRKEKIGYLITIIGQWYQMAGKRM